MRIGITLQSLDPTWGGIGIYTVEIVKHLLKADRNNHYVLIYPGFGPARSLVGQYQRKYDNVTEIETSSSRIPVGTYWDQVVVPPVAKREDVDLLFNPFWSVPLVGKFKKVMIMHAVEQHTLKKVFDLKRKIEWTVRDKLLLSSADAIISISNVMSRDLCRYAHISSERIRTIYHGVSEKFQVISDVARKENAREEYRLPEKFILFVGHIYPQKNFGGLLRAYHMIRNVIPHDLVVIGRPRWKFEQELQLIDTLGLRERIHFLYYVLNDDLPVMYNLAGCFVLPSFYEGFGLALVEAMACGCPVAAARAGAIPEIGEEAVLLYDPHDTKAMADAIVQAVGDSEIRRSCVEKGLTRARHFSWERCAGETLALFEDVGRAIR